MIGSLIPAALTLAVQAAPIFAPTATVFVDRDTPIRLMVLNEVSSRTAQAGHRFVLRVDEPVVVDGRTIVPVGAKAWGEVTAAEESGAMGKAGRLQARLLHLDVSGQIVPIAGRSEEAGAKGGTQVAMGFLGLGPLALFAPGNNAKLKAGDRFTAYFTADQLFEPGSGRFTPAPETPAP